MLEKFSLIEAFGYLATAVVLLSFTMKEIRNLRLVSILGCSMFIVYELLTHMSYPVILTNASILLLNTYYLVKIK